MNFCAVSSVIYDIYYRSVDGRLRRKSICWTLYYKDIFGFIYSIKSNSRCFRWSVWYCYLRVMDDSFAAT